MSINMEPAEGRIVLGRARATEFFPWYEKAGVITRISGKRIYFKTESGEEKFLHEFACVVDTTAEEEALLDFTAMAKQKVKELKQYLTDEDEKVVMSASAPKTVKRTRTRS